MITCPSCGHEMTGRKCVECGRRNLSDSKYCAYCGNLLPEPVKGSVPAGDPYDIESRTLCSDESCIGIINEKGVCTECGRPAGGEE